MQLVKIQEIENWLREPEPDIPGFDFSRLLRSDAPKTKDGGNHRLYYIFRNRTEVLDEDSRLQENIKEEKITEKIQKCTFRVLLPLMKSGAKIDLILDFTKSNCAHFFSSAEIDFYKYFFVYVLYHFLHRHQRLTGTSCLLNSRRIL